jgi:hypothetical protein
MYYITKEAIINIIFVQTYIMYKYNIKLVDNYNKNKNDFIERDVSGHKIIFEKSENSLPLNMISYSIGNLFDKCMISLKKYIIMTICVSNHKQIKSNNSKAIYETSFEAEDFRLPYMIELFTQDIKNFFNKSNTSIKVPLSLINKENEKRKKLIRKEEKIRENDAVKDFERNNYRTIAKNKNFFLNQNYMKNNFHDFSSIVKKIQINNNKNKIIAKFFPSSVKFIKLKIGFNDDITNFPNSVINISLGCCFNQLIKKIPFKTYTLLIAPGYDKIVKKKLMFKIGLSNWNKCFHYDVDDMRSKNRLGYVCDNNNFSYNEQQCSYADYPEDYYSDDDCGYDDYWWY